MNLVKDGARASSIAGAIPDVQPKACIVLQITSISQTDGIALAQLTSPVIRSHILITTRTVGLTSRSDCYLVTLIPSAVKE